MARSSVRLLSAHCLTGPNSDEHKKWPQRDARLGGTLAIVVWSQASRRLNQEAEFLLILGYLRLFWKVFGIKKLNYYNSPLSAGTEQVSSMLMVDF